MKRGSWLVLVLLGIVALLLVSCTQAVPEAQPETATETETSIAQTTTKPEAETESTTTVAPPSDEPIPATFSVSNLTITPKQVTAHSPVTIEVLVTNTGESSGSCSVIIKIDDAIESRETITLEGGASQKTTFRVTKWMTRTYSVSINGQSGSFVVEPPPLPDMDDFMKGMAFSDWAWDIMPRPPKYGPLYYPPQADVSLKKLAATGVNWISLLVNGTQESFRSTKITRDEYITPSDEALRHVIDYAHSLGMRVTLHPALFSLPNTPGISWIEIGTAFNSETQWQEWFASYREFINHYATFAQEAGVDLFYIGSELPGVTHREEDWRRIIKEVRERFKGPISYDSVFWGFPIPEFQRIKWWDAVDYIAVDCWHSLTDKNNPTVAELKEGLIKTGYVDDLENLSRQFNKPVIISEIGYDSLDGTNMDYFGTHNKGGAIDLQEQADCYQAVLEVLWDKPWLKGIFWWQWSAIPTDANVKEWLESPRGKPAEEVLKSFYLS